jgi:hypothetical protein
MQLTHLLANASDAVTQDASGVSSRNISHRTGRVTKGASCLLSVRTHQVTNTNPSRSRTTTAKSSSIHDLGSEPVISQRIPVVVNGPVGRPSPRSADAVPAPLVAAVLKNAQVASSMRRGREQARNPVLAILLRIGKLVRSSLLCIQALCGSGLKSA